MNKSILIFIILPTLVLAQTRHSGNGEKYIKNFQIDGSDFVMDKKLENMASVFLRLSESKPKYELEIYSFSPRTTNYSVIFSLCFYKKVLYLIQADYKTDNEEGAQEIQNLISTVSTRLGASNFKTSDNQLSWKFGNYFAMLNEISATHKTVLVMNVSVGQKLMEVLPSSYALKNNL